MQSVIQQAPTTRDGILDACDRIMARLGFRKMTMDNLAREAAVSRRTIYLHFKSKEDVGLSSIGRVVENVHAKLNDLLLSEVDSPEKLRLMLNLRVMGRIEQIGDYYHSLDDLFEIVRPAYMARRRQMFDREIELITHVLEDGKASGHFSFDSARRTARHMLLATNAFLPYSLSIRELGEPDAIRLQVSGMVDLLIRGVRVLPGETSC